MSCLEKSAYTQNSSINFFLDEQNALAVTIDTDRLHIRSVEASEADYNSQAALFGDPEVMATFMTGATSTKEDLEKRIRDIWVKQGWHKNDPYNILAVFEKETNEFLGDVALRCTDIPGQGELGYLFMKNHWGKGFATEAVTAVVKEYAPLTVEKGYTIKGKPLEQIVATTRIDNRGSIRILENLGMQKTAQEEKYDQLRDIYSINL